MIVGGIPMLFGGVGPVEISLTDTASDATNLTTYTFAGRAFGAAAGNRLMVVGVTGVGTGAGAATSVSVGGVAASLLVEANGAVSLNVSNSSLWIASVPTGTTGDVVAGFAAGRLSCSIHVYRLINAKSTAFSTASGTGSTAVSLSGALNLVANGAAIGLYNSNDGGSGNTTTWTNITERADFVVEGGVAASSAANTTASTETLTITATRAAAPTASSLVLASFSPE